MLAHLAAYDGRLYIYETLDIPLDHYPFPIDVDLTDGIYRPGALMTLPLTFLESLVQYSTRCTKTIIHIKTCE
jgi:hypothetical protein